MAARRGKNQARRNGRNGTRPAWVWVVAGLAIGAVAFLVVPALMKGDGDGFARFGPRANPDAQPAPIADTEAIDMALVTGTLKALPARLPERIEAHWIENGLVGKIREAA